MADRRFNTQPPEGGCSHLASRSCAANGFNTQPPEGGCLGFLRGLGEWVKVSTHSRPKAAADAGGDAGD